MQPHNRVALLLPRNIPAEITAASRVRTRHICIFD
jgi:hypothetical protein